MKYVYLLRNERNQYKVGVAVHLRSRVQTIQTSNADRIEIVAAKLCKEARELEAYLHQYLVDHHTHGGQEWFSLSDHQAIDIAAMMNRDPAMDILTRELSIEQLLVEAKEDRKEVLKWLRNMYSAVTTQPPQVVDDEPFDLAATYDPAPIPQKTTLDDAKEMAMSVFRREGRVSASLIQRKLSMGYAKAARVIDELEKEGRVGPFNGSRPRQLV